MNETRVHTLEQVSHVLEGTQSLEFSRSADNRGRYALIETILQDFPDLTGHEVYVCGSVKMVDTAFPAFLAHGLSEEFTDGKFNRISQRFRTPDLHEGPRIARDEVQLGKSAINNHGTTEPLRLEPADQEKARPIVTVRAPG